MEAPSTGVGLLIIVLFVLPGAVYGLVFERLHGPITGNDATTRILRALAMSALLNFLYVAIFGSRLARKYQQISIGFDKDLKTGLQGVVDKAGWMAMLAFWTLFAIPIVLAVAAHVASRLRFISVGAISEALDLALWNPQPSAWESLRNTPQPEFVRILTKDQAWVGGRLGRGSYITSWPAKQELFISEAWTMGPDGRWLNPVPGQLSIFVNCSEARQVEFLA